MFVSRQIDHVRYHASGQADDFVYVARRLGADEDTSRFEAMLKKIANGEN